MKKIALIVFLGGILLIASSIYVVSYVNYINVKDANESIVKKINKTTANKEKENDNNTTLNNDLTKLQQDLKNKTEEYNVWQSMKEKLNSTISS